MALCGVGFGFFQTPNNATILTAGPPSRSGAAGGMLAVARTLGWCIGSALVTLIFAVSPTGATMQCLAGRLRLRRRRRGRQRLTRRLPVPAGSRHQD